MSYTNNIIARRIPSGLGYLPSTTVRAHTVRGGLGGAASCGPNQQWDPNYVMPGLPPGQCTPKGTPLTKASGVNWGELATSLTSIFAPKPPPTYATAPAYIPPASSGMSPNTMIAIGLGAAGLLAIVMLTRK